MPYHALYRRSLGHPLRVVGLLFALTWPTASGAGPFISEIFLPAWGGTGVEISGLGTAGATLAVVNASPGRQMQVNATYLLPGVIPGQETLSTAVLAGPGWADALPTADPLILTLDATSPLFAAEAAVALVLIEGQSALLPGTRLGSGIPAIGVDADTPIVDWVGFAPGETAALAEALLHPLSAGALAALDIAELHRPAAGTTDVAVLARAILDDGPVMDTLFAANGSVVEASANGLADFLISPGQRNPITLPLTTTPEPHAILGVLVVLLGVAPQRTAWRRRRAN